MVSPLISIPTRLSTPEDGAESAPSPWLGLALLLGGAGVMHLWRPKTFDEIVPERLPGSARLYTYVSGVAELALTLGLAVPRTRRLAGGAAAVFFLAVFPANVKMAQDALSSDDTSPTRKIVALARLPLQIPMVTAALKVRRLGVP